jgi:hypothetical protein
VLGESEFLRFTPQAFIRRVAMLVPAPCQREILKLAATKTSLVKHHPKPLALRCAMTGAQLLKRTLAFDIQQDRSTAPGLSLGHRP